MSLSNPPKTNISCLETAVSPLIHSEPATTTTISSEEVSFSLLGLTGHSNGHY